MNKKHLNFDKILGLQVFSNSKENLLAYILKSIKSIKKGKEKKQLFVVTLNPEFVIASKNDPSFLRVLKKADITVPDGIGLIWAREVMKKNGFWPRVWWGFLIGLKVLKGELGNQVITGTGLMKNLCQSAAKNNWSIFLIGAKPGVAKKALANLKSRFPGLKGWTDAGPQEFHPRGEICKHPGGGIQKINQKKPTFLFVALGMKKQEEFIWRNWKELKVNLAMGVGGAFDYLSGEAKRAPLGWRRLGLEWLYRLLRQSWRIRRQLSLLKFIWLTLTTN